MKSSRRNFLKSSAALSAAAMLSTPMRAFSTSSGNKSAGPVVAVCKGKSPAENTRKVIESLGGIEKFVKAGDKVFLKPNSISTSGPEQALNTHPAVTREVVRLCKLAGASDIVAGMCDQKYLSDANGTTSAIESEGGRILCTGNTSDFKAVKIHRGLILRETQILKDLMDCNVFINIPVAKHHGGTQLTLSLKNYMGVVMTPHAQGMHRVGIHQSIADLATVRRADLTIIDATYILLSNGPGGPGEVEEKNLVIGSSDPLAADAYAATFFVDDPKSVEHLLCAYDLGIGEIDVNMMKIQQLQA